MRSNGRRPSSANDNDVWKKKLISLKVASFSNKNMQAIVSAFAVVSSGVKVADTN